MEIIKTIEQIPKLIDNFTTLITITNYSKTQLENYKNTYDRFKQYEKGKQEKTTPKEIIKENKIELDQNNELQIRNKSSIKSILLMIQQISQIMKQITQPLNELQEDDEKYSSIITQLINSIQENRLKIIQENIKKKGNEITMEIEKESEEIQKEMNKKIEIDSQPNEIIQEIQEMTEENKVLKTKKEKEIEQLQEEKKELQTKINELQHSNEITTEIKKVSEKVDYIYGKVDETKTIVAS